MNGRQKKKELSKIKKRVESSDSIRYFVGQALFEEDAEPDMKFLISEVEESWKEIEALNESLKLLTEKTLGFGKTGKSGE